MKFAIIGKSLPHTLSPKIHTEYFNLDYIKKELNEDMLSNFFVLNDFDGFNVTIPYKEKVIPFLDEVSTEALKIGAVNTVVKKDGKYFGYNTDVFGLEYGLKELKVDLTNKTVLILGSGGTSKTATYLVKKFTDKVFVVSSASPSPLVQKNRRNWKGHFLFFRVYNITTYAVTAR